MSTATDAQRVLDALGPFVGPIAASVGAPTIVAPIVGGLLSAVSRLLDSGRSPEEVIALLERLEADPPDRVDLSSVRARVERELDEDEGPPTR